MIKEGGVCDQLSQEPKKRAAIETIKEIANRWEHRAFLFKNVENIKARYTAQFNKDPETNFDTFAKPFPFLASGSYISKTKLRSLSVAYDIDKVITENFGANSAGVVAMWTRYLTKVAEQRTKTVTLLKNLKQEFLASAHPSRPHPSPPHS